MIDFSRFDWHHRVWLNCRPFTESAVRRSLLMCADLSCKSSSPHSYPAGFSIGGSARLPVYSYNVGSRLGSSRRPQVKSVISCPMDIQIACTENASFVPSRKSLKKNMTYLSHSTHRCSFTFLQLSAAFKDSTAAARNGCSWVQLHIHKEEGFFPVFFSQLVGQ